jgi:uncharacterized membrane protein
MRTLWPFAGIIVINLMSCSGSKTSNDSVLGEPTGATCPAGSTLTYDTFGKQFMISYCVSCHNSAFSGSARQGAPSDHNFDTADGIHATDLSHIDQTTAAGPNHTNTSMPPGDPRPTLEERQKLGEWLACGAP